MKCKHCGNDKMIIDYVEQVYLCSKCGCRNFTLNIEEDKKEKIQNNLTKIKDSQTISNTLYVVTEELGELIQAIQKYQRYLSGDKTVRNKSNKILDNLKEEIVDNYITVTQLAKIIEFDETDFDSRVMEKTERTLKLLGIE